MLDLNSWNFEDTSSLDLDNFSSNEDRGFIFYSDASSEGPLPHQYHLYTVCAIAVKCQHQAMPVSSLHCLSKSAGLWLPYVAVRECYKYSKMAALISEFFFKELGISYDRNKLMENEQPSLFEKILLHSITRIQIPSGEFVTRVIYLARWRPNDKNCCRNTEHIKWVPINVVCDTNQNSNSLLASGPDQSNYQALIDRFWGSEVITFAAYLKSLKIPAIGQLMQVTEQTASEVFKYVQRSKTGEQQQANRNKTVDLFTQFLTDAKFFENDVAKIYSDFVQHCYPSTNMSFTSFNEYCKRIDLVNQLGEPQSLRNVFKAMNYKVKKYIAFNEFLLGLAALDPSSPNNQPRYTYLFRYYDSDSDGYLDQENLRHLLNDLQQKHPNYECKFSVESKMNYDEFVNEIDSNKITGTATLCRSGKPILKLMSEANVYELITNKYNKPFGAKILATCPKCRTKNYTLATHTVKLTKSGRIDDAQLLSCDDRFNEFEIFESKAKNLVRKHSIEYIFKQTSNSNYILGLVRKLAGYNRMNEDRRKEVRTQVVNGLSLNILKTLCDEITEILSVESRVVKVQTPTFVMGDIHGNIHDLLIFEEQLWPMAPAANAPSVLFLGDYVDRGEFGIEVVSYLFAMKILAPNKFFLLRGNHEVRNIQRSFTFEKECLDKYGNNGITVFETFNRVFDILPFAAVVDESIYCAHGGIPFTQTKIEDLMRVPAVLQDPEQEAPAVWEILWSDPITNSEFQELFEFMKKKDDSGYLSNMKRSTAFYFAEIATVNFLKKNNLTHVIRAHEVINEGFKFNHHGMVITVFSCSRYCGGPNKAAAIMIEGFDSEGFIKIISLET